MHNMFEQQPGMAGVTAGEAGNEAKRLAGGAASVQDFVRSQRPFRHPIMQAAMPKQVQSLIAGP